MRPVAVVLSLSLLAPCAALTAQAQPLQFGRKVRVTAPSLGIRRSEATFEYFANGMVVLRVDSTIQCPIASVVRLDVFQGTKSHIDKGAFWGGVAGGTLGLAAGVVWMVECANGGFVCPDHPYTTLILAVPGFVAGAVLGTGIGALIRTDRWEEVPLDRLRMSLAPQRVGQLGIGLSLGF